MSDTTTSDTQRQAGWLQWVAVGVAVGASILVSIAFTYALWRISKIPGLWENDLSHHFKSFVGLPCAAIMSLLLVVCLRQADGPIEFEGLGFKIKGAAGQVLMWVVCFLAIAGAIRLTWN